MDKNAKKGFNKLHSNNSVSPENCGGKMEENVSTNSTDPLVQTEREDGKSEEIIKKAQEEETPQKSDDVENDKSPQETKDVSKQNHKSNGKTVPPSQLEVKEKGEIEQAENGDVVDSGQHLDMAELYKDTQADDKVKIAQADDDEILPVTTEDIKRHKQKLENGLDEVDNVSIWSYVMDRDFRYYFQHPYLRLFIAYFVTFCNFLIYAEDPVAHSMKECTIPMIGNDVAFVCTRYPPNAWSLLKVVLWLAAIVVGIVLGKLLVHALLFNRLFRLRMFENDMGSWMTMFLTTLIVLFIFSLIYNLFLLIGGDSTSDYRISDLLGLTNSIFMKMAATGTWCGDFFTAWMVTDMMLQDKLYPHWAKPVRAWWNRKYNRIILFWVVTSLASFIVVFVIATDYIQWDKLNRDFLHSNEVSRAFLASFILVMDILIVVQDWDFPHFMSAIDIKLPGLNTANIKFDIPKCMKREVWQIHITGKWFNYGILFLVMILDLNMWKNQIFYYPYDYGQYVDDDGKIHSVLDDYSLKNFNKTLLSYNYRSVTINPDTNQTYLAADGVMNTRFNGYHLAIKLLAFIPAVGAFIMFGILIWKFGRRKPSDENVYAGRLMKRKKREQRIRFSFKNFKSKFNLRKKVQAVPKLITFTRRPTNTDVNKGYPENYNPDIDP